jgi:hypothetical protein
MGGGWRLGPLGGHLGGPAVSALVDGQLDEESTEHAWSHVMGCASCRRAVEREGWVKRQLAQMAGSSCAEDDVPDRLLGSLYKLDPVESETRAAWAAVGELEERSRGRRRAGLAAVGVGSVSAAVLGFTALSGSTLGIGGGATPAGPSPASLTRSTPTAGPLAQLGGLGGAVDSRARRSAGSSTGATAPSSFVPFSGWSVSAPVTMQASAAAVANPR